MNRFDTFCGYIQSMFYFRNGRGGGGGILFICKIEDYLSLFSAIRPVYLVLEQNLLKVEVFSTLCLYH